jgi:copper chaperone CopZ
VYNAISALPGVDDVHVSVDTDCVNAA